MSSNDLVEWDVRGPVQVLRTEITEWDGSLEQWKPVRRFKSAWFHPDGRIREGEHYYWDGSVSRLSYEYDAAGRIRGVRQAHNGDATGAVSTPMTSGDAWRALVFVDCEGEESRNQELRYTRDGRTTKVCFVPKVPPNVAYAYDYDDRGQPDEILFYDQDDRLLRSVTIARDSEGRVIKEEMRSNEVPAAVSGELENAPAADREEALALFAEIFGPNGVMFSEINTYDAEGRLLERRTSMYGLGDELTTFRYDDHENPIEQVSEHRSRKLEIEDDGNRIVTEEPSHRGISRFEYIYDERGNWIERVVWIRVKPDADLERSNMERRAITYYSTESG